MAYTLEQRREHRATCQKDDCWCKKSGKSGKRVAPRPRVTRPFITIDGEALGEEGYHLLAASTGDEVSNLEGLSSADCLRFLLALKEKHGKAVYCGYALGYDCEHWIRDFGPSLWKSFKETNEGMVKLGKQTYVIQYIPRKWFKIGRYKGSRFVPEIEVFDVFTFFQASFIATVGSPETGQKKGWGAATSEEMAVLTEWKGKRGSFSLEDWDAIRAYNQIECQVLVRLMSQLREALEGAGVHLRSWHGPGAVANYLLKKHEMGAHIAEPPEEVRDACSRAYFGGRFECHQVGHFEGVYDYDISSAYPYATTLLPSAVGRWERVQEFQGEDAPWTVYLVSWSVTADAGDLKPFPWRDSKGIIHFPSSGRGWYWGFEVAAAMANKRWRKKITIEDGWRLYPEKEGVFDWLKEMAVNRVAAKQQAKETTGEERKRWQGIERGYKLALNSVYGKTIQTVGNHRPFLCPMWAGLITSHTRSRLLKAAIQAPKGSLICFATDGLFSNVPLADIGLGSELGDWELAADNIRLELYQSGCYLIQRADGTIGDTRFRGVSRSDVPWDDLRTLWRRKGMAGVQTVTTRRFIGHRTALQLKKPRLQCQWVEMAKEIKLQPGTGWPGWGDTKRGTAYLWDAQFPGEDYSKVSACYKKLEDCEMDREMDEENAQPA